MGGAHLDDQLKKAVADALSGIFPGEGAEVEGGGGGGGGGNRASAGAAGGRPDVGERDTPEIAEARASAAEVDFSLPFSGENELAAYGVLLQGAESLLKRYPTSLEQDLMLLGKVPMGAAAAGAKNGNEDAGEDGSGWVQVDLATAPVLPPRLQAAISMRVETKRILHAVVLECLLGMRQSYALIAAERALRVSAEAPVPDGDARAQAMEQRRTTVHEKMRAHFESGSEEWEGKWQVWRRRVARVWGKSVREVGNFLEGRGAQSVSSAEHVLSANVRRTEKIVRDLIQKGLLDNALGSVSRAASALNAGGAGGGEDEREMLGGGVDVAALRDAERKRTEDLRKVEEAAEGEAMETIEL
jgi:hypothetical protein